MISFQPVILPEEPPPDDQIDCKGCGLLQHGSRMVWGEGNPAAKVMIILDNPGAREDRQGKAYVCGTRQTLQKNALQSGFSLEDLYLTYILKRRPRRAYDKDQARKACLNHLDQQLREKKPRLIFCLGNVAVQSFFSDPGAEVKNLRGTWYEVKGTPTAVSYHPLAVRRRPNLEPLFLEDWEMVHNLHDELV